MHRTLRLAGLISLVFVTMLIAGCGRKATALNGTWKVEVDKEIAYFKEQEAFKKIPAVAQSKVEAGMKTTLQEMSFTFADGKVTVKGAGGKSKDGEYMVAKMEGDKWQLETLDKDKKNENTTITWKDNDHITLTPSEKEGPMKVDLMLVRQK
ncbi:MAG: hypothetical protein EB084_25195 [Proteobacteria bacterium]|nr:hypothetical protein [Pseudomonadota bacterium]